MARQQRLHQVGTGLLWALIAAGVVLVAVGALQGHLIIFVAGAWLATLGLIVRSLL